MKPFEYYLKPQTTCPDRRDYTTFYAYDKGELLASGPATNFVKSKFKEAHPDAVIQEVMDEDAYKAHRRKYNTESAELHAEFRNDLYQDYGVADNPKRLRCFELAQEHGSGFGLQGVYDCFEDFVELIQDT